jgi:hypothetical protein
VTWLATPFPERRWWPKIEVTVQVTLAMEQVLLDLVGKGDASALLTLGVAGDVGGHPDEAALFAGELVGCHKGSPWRSIDAEGRLSAVGMR